EVMQRLVIRLPFASNTGVCGDSCFSLPLLFAGWFFWAAAEFSFWFGGTVAVFMGVMLFDKPELYGCTFVVPAGAQLFFHVAAVAPVQEFSMRAKDLEGRDGIVGFLHHVVEFGR